MRAGSRWLTLVTAGPVLQIHFSNIMLRIFRRSTLLMLAISLTTACTSVQRPMVELKGISIADNPLWKNYFCCRMVFIITKDNIQHLSLVFILFSSPSVYQSNRRVKPSGEILLYMHLCSRLCAHRDNVDLLCLCSAAPRCCVHTGLLWAWPAAQSVSDVRGCSADWPSRYSQ